MQTANSSGWLEQLRSAQFGRAVQRRVMMVAIGCAIFVFSSGCAVGRRHTSDVQLQENFTAHEAGFQRLLDLVESDKRLEMMGLNGLRYSGRAVNGADVNEIESVGMDRAQWQAYTNMLRDLKLVQVVKDKDRVWFKVDPASISNGSSEKGYCYSESVPGRQVSSLDEYRISSTDPDEFGNYLASKGLKGNWHLFLFVNGG